MSDDKDQVGTDSTENHLDTKVDTASSNAPIGKSFGQWMLEQRQLKGVTLEDIAAVTKIQLGMLRNIEADDYSKLPAPAFIRGFIVNFARHMMIDEKEAVERFREQLKKSDHAQSLSAYLSPTSTSTVAEDIAPPLKRELTASGLGKGGYNRPSAAMDMDATPIITPKRLIIAGIALAVVIVTAILFSIGSKKTGAESTDAASDTAAEVETGAPAAVESQTAAAVNPEASVATPAPEAKKAEPEATPTEAAAANFAYHLKLRGAEGGSYVNVRIDQKSGQGTQLNQGQIKDYYGNEKLVLTMSNAGGVEIFWNGKWYMPAGSRGDVKSLNLPTDLTKLKDR